MIWVDYLWHGPDAQMTSAVAALKAVAPVGAFNALGPVVVGGVAYIKIRYPASLGPLTLPVGLSATDQATSDANVGTWF